MYTYIYIYIYEGGARTDVGEIDEGVDGESDPQRAALPRHG